MPDNRRPSPLLLLTEPGRAAAEYGAHLAAGPVLRRAPRGEGRPVLVLPGFLADDRSTLPLRRLLRSLDYRVHGWRLGRNLGPTQEIVEGLAARVSGLVEEDGEPISLVGWSLGGVFSRGLAFVAPEMVRMVVTLGSPYLGAGGVPSHASRRFRQLSDRHLDLEGVSALADRNQLAVPASSIYSRLDGIVAWETCVDGPGVRRENIEVVASHIGLGFHPAALWAMTDRLAQDPDRWAPFRPPAVLRGLYPAPAVWSGAA